MLPRYFFLWNICSMRWVTIKPPKMLTAAKVTATNPMILAKLMPTGPGGDQRADDDDARYRVGDAHQRRMQRRGHPPDDVVADKDGEHEHRQLEDKGRAASAAVRCVCNGQLLRQRVEVVRQRAGIAGKLAGALRPARRGPPSLLRQLSALRTRCSAPAWARRRAKRRVDHRAVRVSSAALTISSDGVDAQLPSPCRPAAPGKTAELRA